MYSKMLHSGEYNDERYWTGAISKLLFTIAEMAGDVLKSRFIIRVPGISPAHSGAPQRREVNTVTAYVNQITY